MNGSLCFLPLRAPIFVDALSWEAYFRNVKIFWNTSSS